MGNKKIIIDAKTFHDHDKDLIYVDIDSLIKATIFGIDSSDNEDKTDIHNYYFKLLINAISISFNNDEKKARKYLCKIDHIFDDLKLK